MGDIYDWDAYKRGRWKWTSGGYEDGFPRGCAFTDIDFAVEFNGRILLGEGKHWDGLSSQPPGLSKGQALFYQRLAAFPNTTVLVVYGQAGENNPLAARNVGTKETYDWRAEHIDTRRKALKHLIDQAMGLR